VARVAPVEWDECLSSSTNTDDATLDRRLAPYLGLDVALPQEVEWRIPRETIHLPATAEPSLVDYPTESFQATPE